MGNKLKQKEHDANYASNRQLLMLSKEIKIMASKLLTQDYAHYSCSGTGIKKTKPVNPEEFGPVFDEREVLIDRFRDLVPIPGVYRPSAADSKVAEDATAKEYPQLARDLNTRAYYALPNEKKNQTKNNGLNSGTIGNLTPIAAGPVSSTSQDLTRIDIKNKVVDAETEILIASGKSSMKGRSRKAKDLSVEPAKAKSIKKATCGPENADAMKVKSMEVKQPGPEAQDAAAPTSMGEQDPANAGSIEQEAPRWEVAENTKAKSNAMMYPILRDGYTAQRELMGEQYHGLIDAEAVVAESTEQEASDREAAENAKANSSVVMYPILRDGYRTEGVDGRAIF